MYATYSEHDLKEHATSLIFIEYSQNIDVLQKMQRLFQRYHDCIGNHMVGDISLYNLDIDNLVSRQCVDEMCKVNISNYGTIEMIDYKLNSIDISEHIISDKEFCRTIDFQFYKSQITNL